jgi:hypothetical protein
MAVKPMKIIIRNEKRVRFSFGRYYTLRNLFLKLFILVRRGSPPPVRDAAYAEDKAPPYNVACKEELRPL